MRLLPLLPLLLPRARARAPSDPAPISCSLDGLDDYSRTLPFCNLMRQTRACGSAQAPYDHNCSVGEDGWPAQDAFGLVFITLPAGQPPQGVLIDGTYTLTFAGSASLSFPASTVTLLNQSFDGAVTTAFLQVPAQNNGQLWVAWRDAAVSPGSPGARDIALLQPGCSLDDKEALSPSLLSLASRFDSLRFMDWAHTNDSPEAEWRDRRTLDMPSFAAPFGNSVGIPWEAMIKLANTVQRDVWINIPAHASDNYVLQLAALFKATLDPTLFIYYEYSNEVWNWQFEQATYSLHAANASVLADGDPFHLNYDGCGNVGYWQWRRTAYMAKHVADLFKTVFGASAVGAGKRVRPLLCGQAAFAMPITEGLLYLESVWGAPNSILHGLCVAPYFNLPPQVNKNPNLTLDDVFSGFDETIFELSLASGVSASNPLAVQVSLAYHYGLEMRAYEGGPDTSGPNLGDAYLQVKGNATVDPRIQARVQKYLDNWYEWGRVMGPLNYFVAGATNLIDQDGVYGILFDMRLQNESYKLKAVDAVRAAPRAATPADAIPFPPFTANCSADSIGSARPIPPPYFCAYFGANRTFDFFVQMKAEGPLSATPFVSTQWSNATIGVQVNNGIEVLVACPPTPADVAFSACEPARLSAPAGVSVVRVRSIAWAPQARPYAFANISFA
jgi:hypothetical protein